MNRRLRWLAVSGTSALIGAAIGAAVATGISWVQEQPKIAETPATYVQVKQGATQYLQVPHLEDLPPPVWVRSTIQSADNKFQLTSPVFILGEKQDYEVAIPPTLKGGVYTVSVVIGYKLNPLRYVEQSLVIALLIIDGGDHALSGDGSTSRSVGPQSSTGKPSAAG